MDARARTCVCIVFSPPAIGRGDFCAMMETDQLAGPCLRSAWENSILRYGPTGTVPLWFPGALYRFY